MEELAAARDAEAQALHNASAGNTGAGNRSKGERAKRRASQPGHGHRPAPKRTTTAGGRVNATDDAQGNGGTSTAGGGDNAAEGGQENGGSALGSAVVPLEYLMSPSELLRSQGLGAAALGAGADDDSPPKPLPASFSGEFRDTSTTAGPYMVVKIDYDGSQLFKLAKEHLKQNNLDWDINPPAAWLGYGQIGPHMSVKPHSSRAHLGKKVTMKVTHIEHFIDEKGFNGRGVGWKWVVVVLEADALSPKGLQVDCGAGKGCHLSIGQDKGNIDLAKHGAPLLTDLETGSTLGSAGKRKHSPGAKESGHQHDHHPEHDHEHHHKHSSASAEHLRGGKEESKESEPQEGGGSRHHHHHHHHHKK